MRCVGETEVREQLAGLLAAAEAGEEFVILRDGKPIARLLPPTMEFDRDKARQATAAMREASKGITLGGLKIRDLIDEGRR